jgi:protein-S-isoprenylcysteine O-methyltransferase Ste14
VEEIVRFSIPLVAIETTLVNIVVGFFFLVPGAWLGLRGVLDLGLRVSETHRPEKLITRGIYRRIRHPQYLGAILSHLGISIMLSALSSLLVTPILMIRDYVLCKKEDRELAQEFGKEYEDYKQRVPMFLPEQSSQ